MIKFADENKNGAYFVDTTPANNKVSNQLTNASRRYNDDDAFVGALAVGLAAAFVGAAAAVADDDYSYNRREAERARREAEEAERRAREEERRAREEQRYLENKNRELIARMNHIYGGGLTLDEVTDKVSAFMVKPQHEDIMKRAFTIRLVLKTLWNQGVRFQKIYDYDRHNLTITGQDIDGRTVNLELSWTGKIQLDCYGASLVRYDTGKPFKNYESLVKASDKDAYEELYRALSY